jgi:hypothetical protein
MSAAPGDFGTRGCRFESCRARFRTSVAFVVGQHWRTCHQGHGWRFVVSDQSFTVLDHCESDLELLAAVADWQPHASNTDDLAMVSVVDSTPVATDSMLDTVDDAFALLVMDLESFRHKARVAARVATVQIPFQSTQNQVICVLS